MATRKDFAKVILSMNWGEMRHLASELSEMKDPVVRPKIETAEEYADLLFDWAEAQQYDDELAAETQKG